MDVNMTVEEIRENLITYVEEYFCEQITNLIDMDMKDDADSFYQEFVVNGEEPEEWLFVNDLNDL
jgi:hypothetical protein